MTHKHNLMLGNYAEYAETQVCQVSLTHLWVREVFLDIVTEVQNKQTNALIIIYLYFHWVSKLKINVAEFLFRISLSHEDS